MNKMYSGTAFGNVVVVNDYATHRTHRIEFGTQQEARGAVLELTFRSYLTLKAEDLKWLKAEATRSQYMARGIIVA